MPTKPKRKKVIVHELSAAQRERRDALRRLRHEKRQEHQITSLIGQLTKLTYQRQQRLMQLAAAIVGKDFKIVPVHRVDADSVDTRERSTV